MAHPSPRDRESALEIARKNCAASKRPLSPMMQTAVTARALAGDGLEKRTSGAVPEASD